MRRIKTVGLSAVAVTAGAFMCGLPTFAATTGGASATNNSSSSVSVNSSNSTTSTSSSSSTTTSGSASTTPSGTRLATVISKGDAEITRRLTSLTAVSTKIAGMTKLTAADQTALTSQVSTTASGLTALKTKLDAETTASAAVADAQSIYSEYRVYALVLPKVYLIRTADDQQATEAKLSALATKISTRLQTATSNGKTVTSEQASLTDMQSQISAATSISAAMETSVLPLQPTDYNADHALLTGDSTKLKQAQTDIQAAITDAKSIIAGLKAL